MRRTLAAILIGLAGSLFIAWAAPFNNFILGNAFISDDFLPVAAFFPMLLLLVLLHSLFMGQRCYPDAVPAVPLSFNLQPCFTEPPFNNMPVYVFDNRFFFLFLGMASATLDGKGTPISVGGVYYFQWYSEPLLRQFMSGQVIDRG